MVRRIREWLRGWYVTPADDGTDDLDWKAEVVEMARARDRARDGRETG